MRNSTGGVERLARTAQVQVLQHARYYQTRKAVMDGDVMIMST